MRAIPSALQDKLDSGITTLCRCWRVTCRDGAVLGFTDHDEDVMLGDLVCRAGSGLSGSEVTSRLGFAVGGSEMAGALADDSLSEDELAAGRYDMAAIELHLVDWVEPHLRVLLASGTIGEVRREGAAFAAEVRGLTDKLNQESGRRYAAACSADLGDGRCRVNLSQSVFTGTGTVTAFGGVLVTASGLASYADGWFTAGRLTWTGGVNQGLAVEVKSHRVQGGTVTLELWQAMAHPVGKGDTFAVTAGCDKRFGTCRSRFDNIVNYRGFPHIPGNDFITRYAIEGEPGHDGRSLQQ